MGHHTGIENGTQDRYFNGAAHWGESFNNGAYPNVGGFYTADYPVQGGFHLFTLIWTEDSVAMYLDSIAQPYFQLSLRDKDINRPGHYFNHPFYLVLNLSVGGFFPGMPAAEKYPALITADNPSFRRVTALPADGTEADGSALGEQERRMPAASRVTNRMSRPRISRSGRMKAMQSRISERPSERSLSRSGKDAKREKPPTSATSAAASGLSLKNFIVISPSP